MIQIDKVQFIPDLPFRDAALATITEAAWEELQQSQNIYVAREAQVPLFCIGAYKPTLLSRPYLWMLPCEALDWRHLRELRDLFDELAPAALWALVQDDPKLAKFAAFFGLRPVQTVDNYLMMER